MNRLFINHRRTQTKTDQPFYVSIAGSFIFADTISTTTEYHRFADLKAHLSFVFIIIH